MLVFLSWKVVVPTFFALNVLWAILMTRRHVSVNAAFLGAVLVRLKWLVCPGAALYLYLKGSKAIAALALLWPFVVLLIGIIPTTQIGRIERMFLAKLGYQDGNFK